MGEREFWDKWALGVGRESHEREAGFVAAEPLWQWAVERSLAGRPRRILDLGCGRGFTTPLLAGAGAEVVGLDLSTVSLSIARRFGGAAQFVGGRLEALPFPDATFDVVAGRFVLHHSESLEHAASEVLRVLRPDGVGVFVETWGQNPLLRCGRDLALLFDIGFGSPEEAPLGVDELAVLGRHFEVVVEFPVFTGLGLLNRVFTRLKPLARRSRWVRDRLARLWHASASADRAIERHHRWLMPWGWHAGLVLRPLMH